MRYRRSRSRMLVLLGGHLSRLRAYRSYEPITRAWFPSAVPSASAGATSIQDGLSTPRRTIANLVRIRAASTACAISWSVAAAGGKQARARSMPSQPSSCDFLAPASPIIGGPSERLIFDVSSFGGAADIRQRSLDLVEGTEDQPERLYTGSCGLVVDDRRVNGCSPHHQLT